MLNRAMRRDETDESVKVLEYLVKCAPEYLEIKEDDTHTPLGSACSYHKIRFAKVLIDAGANQAVCDEYGHNLMRLAFQAYHGGNCSWAAPNLKSQTN